MPWRLARQIVEDRCRRKQRSLGCVNHNHHSRICLDAHSDSHQGCLAISFMSSLRCDEPLYPLLSCDGSATLEGVRERYEAMMCISSKPMRAHQREMLRQRKSNGEKEEGSLVCW